MIRRSSVRCLLVFLGCAIVSARALAGDHVWTTGGPAGTSFVSIAVDPFSPSTIYAVGYDTTLVRTIFKSTDGGTSWTAIYADFGVEAVTIDPSAPATVYAVGPVVLKSVDGGESWIPTNTGLNDRANVLVIDPQSPATLYVGATIDGIFKSSDGGAHWSAVGTGLPLVVPGFGCPCIPRVSAIALDSEKPSTLYAGFGAEFVGIYKSTDAGLTWNPVNDGLNTAFGVEAIAMDPTNPSRLYAISAGIVHKTDDGGAHWRYANAGVTNNLLNALAVDPRIPTTLYLGTSQGYLATNQGLFRSIDAAESWSPFNEGLPPEVVILSLAVAPLGLAVHAGTLSHGIFDLGLAPDRLPIVRPAARPGLPIKLDPRP